MGKRISKKSNRKASASEKRAQRAKITPTKNEMALNERFRISPSILRLTEDANGVHVPNRIQLFRTGTFKKLMPDGKSIEFSITKETLEEMVHNFNAKVRGTDIAVDFAHKSDEEAAGWFKDLKIEDLGHQTQLWADVEWTTDGFAAVEGKKFRYLSPDFAFAWTDNETGEKYGATLFGAGLTNRPVIKNMAPTVELTEVTKMAKTTVKKISEMNREDLELLLSEEKDGQKKELIQLRLDEMSEDDGADDENEDDGETEPKKKPKDVNDMNLEELKAAFQKQCDEMAELKKNQEKTMAETAKKEKEAKFAILLAEGKAVPAQKESFLSGDMETFVSLSEKPKFGTIGGHGSSIEKKTGAADEVLKLAEEAVKAGKTSKNDSISYVLANNPELNARHVKEMEAEVA